MNEQKGDCLNNLCEKLDTLSGIPIVTNGFIRNCDSSFGSIEVLYSQDNFKMNRKSKFSKYFSKDGRDHNILIPKVPNIQEFVRTRNDDRFSFVFRSNNEDCGKSSIQVLNSHRILKTIQVKKSHSKFRFGSTFGTLSVSPKENKFIYIAESSSKCESKEYWEEKSEEEKYLFKSSDQNFGERMKDVHRPRIFECDWDKGEITKVEGVCSTLGCSYAQYAPDGSIVFSAWKLNERRLGLIYCQNRQSDLYVLSSDRKKCEKIDVPFNNVISPIFSPDMSKIAFLSFENLCHYSCARLLVIDWNTKKCRVVVDIKDKWSSGEDDFLGLFPSGTSGYSLHEKCWTSDSQRLVVESIRNSKLVVYIIDVENGTPTLVKNPWGESSLCFLDQKGGELLLLESTFTQPFKVFLVKEKELTEKEKWRLISSSNDVLCLESSRMVNNLEFKTKRLFTKYDPKDIPIEVLIVKPKNVAKQKLPTIFWVHGGPHSCSTLGFYHSVVFLVDSGYAVCVVNYRGSSGFGQDGIKSLLGNIGDLDLRDVKYVVDYFVEKEEFVDKNKLIIKGGSHGGFITLSMIGKYPDLFKVALTRNPVTDLVAFYSQSDIRDWSVQEMGMKDFGKEFLQKAYDRSPIRYVSKVKTPVLIMLGEDDLRVPPEQGKDYYFEMMKVGKEDLCKLKVYPGNSHSLGNPTAVGDSLISHVLWIEKNLTL